MLEPTLTTHIMPEPESLEQMVTRLFPKRKRERPHEELVDLAVTYSLCELLVLLVKKKNVLRQRHMALACGSKNSRIVRLLFGLGLKVNVEGDSYLGKLETMRHRTMFEVFIELGADVNAKDERGLSALSNVLGRCPRSSFVKRVSVLLKIGADPNSEDDQGRTPLVILSKRRGLFKKFEVMRMLIRFGADERVGNFPRYLEIVCQYYDEARSLKTKVDRWRQKKYFSEVCTLFREGASLPKVPRKATKPAALKTSSFGLDNVHLVHLIFSFL